MVEISSVPNAFLNLKSTPGVEVTTDKFGNLLTRKDSDGWSVEYTRDNFGNVLTRKDSTGRWEKYTRDTFGNVLTREDSKGWRIEYTRDDGGRVIRKTARAIINGHPRFQWEEYTRDSFGNVLTFKDCDGFWEEYTRDTFGNVLTRKCSIDNILLICIANDDEYDLYVSEDRTCIRAGCRRFDSVSKALEHWSGRTDARAILFTEALRKL